MSKHVADPTPRSPSNVIADRCYRTVADELSWGPLGGHRVYRVVFHTGTETYWEAIYDSTSCDMPANWSQVIPKQVQRVEYQRI